MLVLSRKTGEKIKIGPDIWITVIRIGPNNTRLGIDAPEGIEILREEVLAAADFKPRPRASSVEATS
jgi:carbon storage regulator